MTETEAKHSHRGFLVAIVILTVALFASLGEVYVLGTQIADLQSQVNLLRTAVVATPLFTLVQGTAQTGAGTRPTAILFDQAQTGGTLSSGVLSIQGTPYNFQVYLPSGAVYTVRIEYGGFAGVPGSCNVSGNFTPSGVSTVQNFSC